MFGRGRLPWPDNNLFTSPPLLGCPCFCLSVVVAFALYGGWSYPCLPLVAVVVAFGIDCIICKRINFLYIDNHNSEDKFLFKNKTVF